MPEEAAEIANSLLEDQMRDYNALLEELNDCQLELFKYKKLIPKWITWWFV